MIPIKQLRNIEPKILCVGAHKGVIQSILDFDFLSKKSTPSIIGILGSNSKYEKFFWGKLEILLPTISSYSQLTTTPHLFINFKSARRVKKSTLEVLEHIPDLLGGHIFAEDVPELHALEIAQALRKDQFIVGPSGVGLLIPKTIKLGALGGTDPLQFDKNKIFTPGNTAVISSSGIMTNEYIRELAKLGKRVSFACAIGGDRFPITSVTKAMLTAEHDSTTNYIAYFGELGGTDEYEITKLIEDKKLTKPIFAYIGGVIDEAFDKPTQFGHAKALAKSADESAQAKRKALAEQGVKVGNSFEEFVNLLQSIETNYKKDIEYNASIFQGRRHTSFTSSISNEVNSEYHFIGKSLKNWTKEHSFIEMIVTGLLGHIPRSAYTVQVFEKIFMTFLDHGPQVSGALNTLISARAGKDLVSSLASGLLTIGPKFGGATNGAAKHWFNGVINDIPPAEFVESFSQRKENIPGIGHKKYRVGIPDPRQQTFNSIMSELKNDKYYSYAKEIEKITTAKKGNLILNIDGFIAALLLDIMESEEKYDITQIEKLITIEFFNAPFVLARSIGFTSHFLDQKRMEEGLFRLPDDLIHFKRLTIND